MVVHELEEAPPGIPVAGLAKEPFDLTPPIGPLPKITLGPPGGIPRHTALHERDGIVARRTLDLIDALLLVVESIDRFT